MFSARLKELMKTKGATWKRVSAELSIGKNQPKYWADNDVIPDGKTLIKLADYFGVSIDYLCGRSESGEVTDRQLTADEERLLSLFAKLSEVERLRLLLDLQERTGG